MLHAVVRSWSSPGLAVLALLPACASSSLAPPLEAPDSNRGEAGAVWFIAPGGDDGHSGDSPLAPWGTWDHALRALAPGDTLEVLDGTYAPDANGVPDVDCTAGYANGTRGYWIGDATASLRGSNLAIALTVVRGNDMLAVVLEDSIILTMVDSIGSVVGTFQDRVYLPASGSSQSFAHTVDGIAPGTYTITAVLGSPAQPVDVWTVTLSV